MPDRVLVLVSPLFQVQRLDAGSIIDDLLTRSEPEPYGGAFTSTLVEVDLLDDPERVAHFVQAKESSTERQYYLRVPPSITCADEAVAWTFGLRERVSARAGGIALAQT